MEASAILPTLPLISRSIHRLPTPSTYRLLFLSRQPSSSLSLSTRRFSNLLRSLSPLTPSPTPNPLFDTRAHSSFGDGGGDDAGGVGPGSGGGGGGGGGEAGTKPIAAGEGEDIASLGSDAIILDVGGMSCGGCVASVKRILESQPQVSSASVNLATETAVVWAVPEAKVTQNWKQQLGEKLATHLTTCGFKSNLRDSGKESLFDVFEKKMNEKLFLLKRSGRELAFSWTLCAVCLLGHAAHFLGTNAPQWIHVLHSTRFHMSLSLFTLIGPGRRLILEGLRKLFMGAPNMNTLVSLGALSSFAISTIAAFLPKLGWKAFFEEPIMLIAFVLLGKNLEQRAKLKASSDMTGLLSILPTKARLLVKENDELSPSVVEVPCSDLSVGDNIAVLPGDRIPADGIVRGGRSTVDESSFTGEPLPVTKLPGAEVTAGSINLNGTLTVEVRRPGGETLMGDIVRLVEEAQTREAPVQRLADTVAGRFTYGVMAFSATTFVFWNTFASQIVPATVYQGNSTSLALQLACSVLVVACPCALGLATPAAVLVGTSVGATRGLLLRGGNVLEKLAEVDTVVFDKTGTLTIGRPVISKVLASEAGGDNDSQGSNPLCTEDVLRLAAAVESSTNHPVGKAILDAARAAGCNNAKAVDGSFSEEPGSGAAAVVQQKKVTVGTLSWLERNGVVTNPLQEPEELKNHSVVYVGADGDLIGHIYFEDKIREEAKQVVASLARQGIEVYILSGDKRSTADHVASVVGISKDKVISGVRPDGKKSFVRDLQNEGKVVAMVGDGVNDAAALASSNIGIAMGEGVGAASDVSDVVLMRSKLSQLLDSMELSRLTMRTIKQNLWWAFAYNIVGIPVAAGVLLPFTGTMLTPSIAGALMGLSSVGVMANSLLLRAQLGSKRKPMYKFPESTKLPSLSDVLVDIDGAKEKPHGAKWRNT